MAELIVDGGLTALVDEEDLVFVRGMSWRALHNRRDGRASKTYAQNGAGKLLHRVILAPPDGVLVDHINGNGLDCRRANLRLASRSENARNRGKQRNNTSGHKGVSYNKRNGRWLAFVKLDQHMHNLGYYDTPEEAAVVASSARKLLHGSFASD